MLMTGGVLAADQAVLQRLADLEARVAELERMQARNSDEARWRTAVYWERLQKGMAAGDVVRLLGRPARVENRVFTTWYYHPTSRLHSFVWFDQERVLGWKAPDL